MNRKTEIHRLLIGRNCWGTVVVLMMCCGLLAAGQTDNRLTSRVTDVRYDPETTEVSFKVELTNNRNETKTLFNPFDRSMLPQPLRVEVCDGGGKVLASWEYPRYRGSQTLPRAEDWVVLPVQASILHTASRHLKYAELRLKKSELLGIKKAYLRISFVDAMLCPITPFTAEEIEKYHQFSDRFRGSGTLAVSELVELPAGAIDALKNIKEEASPAATQPSSQPAAAP